MGGNRQSSEHIIANCQWETFLVLLPLTQSLRWVSRHWTGNRCLSPKPVLAGTLDLHCPSLPHSLSDVEHQGGSSHPSIQSRKHKVKDEVSISSPQPTKKITLKRDNPLTAKLPSCLNWMDLPCLENAKLRMRPANHHISLPKELH